MSRPFTVVVPVKVTDASLVAHSVPETDHAEYSASTTYNTGDRVILPSVHFVYECLSAGVLNKYPPDNPLQWVEVGPTNRWAAFDESGGTLTVATTTFEFQVTGDRIDTFGFLDVDANTIRIQATSPEYPNYFDKTIELTDAALVNSWFTYFSAPIQRKRVAVEFGVPSIRNSTYTITIAGSGQVSLGTFVMGHAKEFGFMEYGASVSIKSYGAVVEDDYGRRTRVRRGYARRMNVSVLLEKSVTDAVQRQFEALRETAALWVAADGMYESTTIYGDYKDFQVLLQYPTQNQCTLQIEGIA
jgi:hypothetical protein